MDFKKYYLQQTGGNYPIFRGTHFQRGYGIGGVFRRLFSWFMPILKEHALPASKNIGKEIIKSTSDFANDLIDGKKDFFISDKNPNKNQKGNGYKRKRNLKKDIKKKNKKFKDIFSK